MKGLNKLHETRLNTLLLFNTSTQLYIIFIEAIPITFPETLEKTILGRIEPMDVAKVQFDQEKPRKISSFLKRNIFTKKVPPYHR